MTSGTPSPASGKPAWWEPWVAPGVVVAIVVATGGFISWQLAQISGRFDSLDKRFETVDKQYIDVGNRLTNLDAKLDRRADNLTQVQSGFTARIDGALQQQAKDLGARIDAVLQQQATIAKDTNGRIDNVIQQQAALSSQVAEIKSDTIYIKGTVEKMANKLQVTEMPPSQSPIHQTATMDISK
jgi:chaperonin cofactor prefoldin